MFVVTRQPPTAWPNTDTPYTFVTNGLKSAITQTPATAPHNVSVGPGTPISQASPANPLDELHIDLVPPPSAPTPASQRPHHLPTLHHPEPITGTGTGTGTGITHLIYQLP